MLIEIQKPNKYIDSILLEKESGFHLYHYEGKTFMHGEGTEEQALAALEAHNPIEPNNLTVQQKLEKAGLTVEELKEALGL
jgi:hypothetical protein